MRLRMAWVLALLLLTGVFGPWLTPTGASKYAGDEWVSSACPEDESHLSHVPRSPDKNDPGSETAQEDRHQTFPNGSPDKALTNESPRSLEEAAALALEEAKQKLTNINKFNYNDQEKEIQR
jgi:hypothetical protein